MAGAVTMFATIGTMLLGTKKRAMLLVVVAAAAVYFWQEWTISDLETDVQKEAHRADAAERNVREYAAAIQKRNKRVERAKKAAKRANERASQAADKVLEQRRRRSQQIQKRGAETAEELNQWLEQRFPSQ